MIKMRMPQNISIILMVNSSKSIYMKQVDIRLSENEVSLLHSMTGKEFNAFLHDAFNYTESSAQAVELIIAGKSYYICSFTEEKDYFRSPEDVAVWTVSDEKLPVIDKKSFV